MSEKPIDNMANIVLVIKMTNYIYEMRKRGYDLKETSKQLNSCWDLVCKERGE